jgi:hypothetical protein
VEECTYFWGVNTSWGIIRKIIRLHNQHLFLRKKLEVFQHLKDFNALVETQSGKNTALQID